MNRELDEEILDNICSSDNEEEIEELVYPHYPSDQEEISIQVGLSESTSLRISNHRDINNESPFLEEVYSPINHLINLITTNYFNERTSLLEQSNLLEQNGFSINEDFGEVLIIGEDIILIDEHLGDFLIISTTE